MSVIKDFQSSLLREKFVIHDPDVNRHENTSITALSNRMIVQLQNDSTDKAEEYVVRAQNMHSCARLCGRLIQSYNTGGSLLNRAKPYDWDAAWDPIVNDYERIYNEERWIAVYHKGRVVFESGERHALLDLIEKCDFENDQDYDYSIPMAENVFKQTGKVVKIDYESNVALVTTFNADEARCGVIFRGAGKTTTFNFTAYRKADQTLNIPQCLSACAAFLEGIQLAFMVGFNTFKMRVDIIEAGSDLEKETKEAQRRLGRLNAEIANLDTNFDLRFRPEKPEFYRIVAEAEDLASRTVQIPEKKQKPFGADDD